MNMLVKVLSVCVVVLGFSGCASILNEETQQVNVVSSTGAKFSATVDGKTFEGPSIVEFKRAKEDKIIKVSTDGCAAETVAQKKVSSVFWLNLLSGGAFGSTTDMATEKMWEYDNQIEINCKQ